MKLNALRIFATTVLLGGCQLVLGFEDHELAEGGGVPGELPVGAPCSGGGECRSTFCVDGVCCAQVCNDTCVACSEALTGMEDGTCSFVTTQTDPHDDCEVGGSDCAGDVCSGTGPSCAPANEGDSCGEPSCVNNALVVPICDAELSCRATPGDCGGHLCDDSGCTINCGGDDALCLDAFHCTGTQCTPDLALGDACTRDEQCPDGHCVDGVCCESACTGQCRVCGVGGVCANIPNGMDDPQQSCPGMQTCCNGNCQNGCS